MFAAAHEWIKSGSMLKSTSWTTEDAMAMMAGGPAMEWGIERAHCFSEDVQPPPQSVADVPRSHSKAERTAVGRTTGRDHGRVRYGAV